jgi:hypothetical protein
MAAGEARRPVPLRPIRGMIGGRPGPCIVAGPRDGATSTADLTAGRVSGGRERRGSDAAQRAARGGWRRRLCDERRSAVRRRPGGRPAAQEDATAGRI